MSAQQRRRARHRPTGTRRRNPRRTSWPRQSPTRSRSRADAAEIRGEETELTRKLYLNCCRSCAVPIPAGFIVTTGVVTGKPYESTGIKSLQVQIDRLDNVLTPARWGWTVEYEQDGQLAHARAWIGADPDEPFVVREARGGVNRGSTIGNLYKGSETNAAKLALARLGPGHEVYLGAADFDPDVDPLTQRRSRRRRPARRPHRASSRPRRSRRSRRRSPRQGSTRSSR
jgi:hypothetical protein